LPFLHAIIIVYFFTASYLILGLTQHPNEPDRKLTKIEEKMKQTAYFFIGYEITLTIITILTLV